MNGKKIVTGKKAYNNGKVNRGEDEEESKVQERTMDEYVRVVNKHCELFSFYDPETILQCLVELSEDQCLSYKVSPDTYKIKMIFAEEEETEDEEKENVIQLECTAKILQVPDTEKICIEFIRNEGNLFTFHEYFKKIKDFLGEYINAVY